MTKEKYIEEYKKVLTIKRVATNTAITYLSCLKSFLYWCEEADIFPPNLTKSQLLDYLSKIKSYSLLKQARGTIDNFYKHVLGIPYICAGIPYPRRSHSLPEYLTVYELNQVFNAVKNNKQRIILKIQYVCALRVHEVVKIKWNDFVKAGINYDLRVIGKGGKYAYLPIPPETITEITQFLGNSFGINEYIFKGQFKDHYSERSVQEIINRAMESCGIYKNGSTHLLRHSRATHLIQNGSSTRHVQGLLRHASNKTTEIYTHLNTTDLRIAFDKSDVLIKELLQTNQLALNEH